MVGLFNTIEPFDCFLPYTYHCTSTDWKGRLTTAVMEFPDEKRQQGRIEDPAANVEDESAERFNSKQAASIRHRIDMRLIPPLGAMYGISLMDRKNISNASIAGMRVDLDLEEGYRYSLITLSFFITYVIFQSSMTVVCRKVGPRIFLPGICMAWGLVVLGFGFLNNWTSMVGLRLVMGILEAGYFPGCVYLLSTWYTRCKSAIL